MDERQDSIRQGIGVPPESQVGRDAEQRKQEQDARTPCRETGGMGGTSGSVRTSSTVGRSAARAASQAGPTPSGVST